MTRIGNPTPIDRLLTEAVTEATDKLATWLSAEFTTEITTAKWAFPTPPQVRDIVGSGRLLRSQTVQRSGPTLTFTWGADYAAQVHEGGVGTTGMRFPGRPWTIAPLAQAQERFNGFLTEALGRRP